MVAVSGIVVLLISCLPLVLGNLEVDCGSPTTGPATLRFVGDVHSVTGLGINDGDCSFHENFQPGTFTLNAGYDESQGQSCLFKRDEKLTDNYEIKVDTHTHQFLETEGDMKFLVVCSFSTMKENVIRKVPLTDVFLPPTLLSFHESSQSKSSFAIFPTDYHDEVIKVEILQGRIVKLKTFMAANVEDKGNGYIPLTCTVGNLDSSILVTILADGCGTGFPWPSNKGFEMEGISGISPMFEIMRIKDSKRIAFRCTFVVCKGACDGSSCITQESRRKRSLQSEKMYNATFGFW